MSEKTYYLNGNGVLADKDTEKTVYSHAVFVYDTKKGEDINTIVGEAPLIYRSAKELSRELHKSDIEEWLNEGYTVVIRPVNIVDIS